MIDKIRLHARGELPADYQAALGNGHDRILCGFLKLAYVRLRDHVLENSIADDEQLLEWAYQNGRRLVPDDLVVINGFFSQRAWCDESASNHPGWLIKTSPLSDAFSTTSRYAPLSGSRRTLGIPIY
jgi:gluconokinase